MSDIKRTKLLYDLAEIVNDTLDKADISTSECMVIIEQVLRHHAEKANIPAIDLAKMLCVGIDIFDKLDELREG